MLGGLQFCNEARAEAPRCVQAATGKDSGHPTACFTKVHMLQARARDMEVFVQVLLNYSDRPARGVRDPHIRGALPAPWPTACAASWRGRSFRPSRTPSSSERCWSELRGA